MIGHHWDAHFSASHTDLLDKNLLRRLRSVRPGDAVHVELDDRLVTIFSSNDYLGLSSHPAVRDAAAETARAYGSGPRAAALICGHTTEHEALEAKLARLLGTETALLVPTGFQASLAVLTSLAGPDLTIFSDALNHASVVDGCHLARRHGAALRIYRHADAGDLRKGLEECVSPRKMIVTDSVFAVDGDQAPLRELVELGREHEALLVVNEAHALLVYGERGGGLTEALGLEDGVHIRTGSMGKAIGAHGGFVATDARLREHLLNRGRSFIFSTALPLPVVAAARASLRTFRVEPEHRARLWSHVRLLGDILGRTASTPILPVILGEEARALRASDALFGKGFLVPGVRPPTVPEGTCRLRITLSAAHEAAEVESLAKEIRDTILD